MSSIVWADIPAADFALQHTLDAVSDLVVQCEESVQHGQEVVMPFLWADAEDMAAFEAALEDDPTVEGATQLATCDQEVLYLMEWASGVELVVEILVNASGTILDAHATGDAWRFRILYPEREQLSKTGEFCESHAVEFDVVEIHELDVDSAGRYGLTDAQAETLSKALQAGYFDVPRETDIADLAEEIGISHQALSERIRRAQGELVGTLIRTSRPRSGEARESTTHY